MRLRRVGLQRLGGRSNLIFTRSFITSPAQPFLCLYLNPISKIKMDDNKAKFQEISIAPMHTAEHLLNQTMVRMFGCERSNNAHIERKKSKIAYTLDKCPSEETLYVIVDKMNELIDADLPVYEEYAEISRIPASISLKKLPEGTGSTIRLVHIGNYDVCPCIGLHAKSTKELGHFHLLGTNWNEETKSFRIRFKLDIVEQ